MASKAQLIHDKTIELLGTMGMRFVHPDAIEVLKKHGVKVDGQIAYFTEEQIMKCVELAPSKVKIYARDPQYDMELGSGQTYIGPMMGGIRVLDKEGNFHAATVDDMIIANKIVEYNKRYHVNGGGTATPSDVPADKYMLFHLWRLCYHGSLYGYAGSIFWMF